MVEFVGGIMTGVGTTTVTPSVDVFALAVASER
jgi:hypothetical protein